MISYAFWAPGVNKFEFKEVRVSRVMYIHHSCNCLSLCTEAEVIRMVSVGVI